MAVLWLYTTIFTTKNFKLAARIIMGIDLAYMLVFIPIFYTNCTPITSAWDPMRSRTDCRPSTHQEFASVAVNMFLDVVLVILPLPVVWGLRMPTRKKITVSIMLSFGLMYVFH